MRLCYWYNISESHSQVFRLKLADIFREGSDARKLFAKFYAVAAIGIILTVLVLLAFAARGG